MWETLENGDLYLEMKHAGLLLKPNGEAVINLCSRDYGYNQFNFKANLVAECGDIEAKKQKLIEKYEKLIEWLWTF